MEKKINLIKEEITKLKSKGSFAQNVAIVFSGNTVNFLVQLIFTPILSRVFSPEAYGEYALFNIIVSNITLVGSLSLTSGLVIAKDNITFFRLGKILLISTFGVTVFSLIIYFLVLQDILNISNTSILIILMLIAIHSINMIMICNNQRKKEFIKTSQATVIARTGSKSGSLFVGHFLTSTGLGLLIGDLINAIILFILQTKRRTKLTLFTALITKDFKELKSVWWDHIKIPKFIFPSQLLGKFSGDLPVIIIGAYYSLDFVGAYTFALSIINIPINLINGTVRPIMQQKANEAFNYNPRKFKILLIKSMLFFPLITGIPSFTISLFSPSLFSIVFGEKWQLTGVIVAILWIQIICNTLVSIYMDFWNITKTEKTLFKINIVSIVLKLIPIFALLIMELPFNHFVILFSISSAIGSLIMLADILKYSLPSNNFAKVLSSIVVAIFTFYFILLAFTDY